MDWRLSDLLILKLSKLPVSTEGKRNMSPGKRKGVCPSCALIPTVLLGRAAVSHSFVCTSHCRWLTCRWAPELKDDNPHLTVAPGVSPCGTQSRTDSLPCKCSTVLVCVSCCNKIPWTGGLSTTHMYFPQLWRLEIPARADWVSGEPASWLLEGCLLAVSSHGARGEGALWGLHSRDTNPTMRAPPSWPHPLGGIHACSPQQELLRESEHSVRPDAQKIMRQRNTLEGMMATYKTPLLQPSRPCSPGSPSPTSASALHTWTQPINPTNLGASGTLCFSFANAPD